MTFSEIVNYIRTKDDQIMTNLWAESDQIRRTHVGDEIHLRGLIEISNYCARRCAYCGIQAGHSAIERYRMTSAEIMACVHQIVSLGYGTVVMQSGEDYGISAESMASIIRKIKSETPLAITLSLGERPISDMALWKKAGADRYLLRFETSDPDLYKRIHPPLRTSESPQHRIGLLTQLRSLGYEIGSGIMIGIPGQTMESLAHDILLFKSLDLDMIGVGPYIPNPESPLQKDFDGQHHPDQAPNSEEMTYKVIALARLVCPDANIPSTTALATINQQQGRELGLMRGANVVMPNVTPTRYRSQYAIYPGKACIHEEALDCSQCIKRRIESMGRTIGRGKGSRRHSCLPRFAPESLSTI